MRYEIVGIIGGDKKSNKNIARNNLILELRDLEEKLKAEKDNNIEEAAKDF